MESPRIIQELDRFDVRLFTLGGTPITASVGVAVFPADGATSSALLRAADRALYSAKHDGKNRLATTGVADVDRLASWR